MADAKRTIELVFEGVDNTGAAVQSALRNTGNLASNVQSATQPFADVTAAALKYEAALIATGAAITAFSVKAAGDFDGAFREIATLIDEPVDALGEFRQEILDYAADSTGSLAEVTTSIYNAISAGVDYTDSLEAVRTAEQLAVAGKGELDNTLKLLVSSLNAYGLEMSDAERFSDALFTTVRQGQTTLPELTASLSEVTGVAATVGVPFEEVLAALAALTAAGTPTSQAVTQISSVLASVLKPSQQAATAAEQLGIEFSAQAVRAEGLQGFLQQVAEATGGSEAQMAKLFPRVEALRAVFPLTGLAADKFSSSLDAINGSAGATGEAYDKLSSSLQNVTGRLSSSLETLLVSIGDPLLDDLGGVAEGIGAVFAAITASFDEGELSGITSFIEAEFANLATTLQGIAAALPEALSDSDLTGFTDGLEAVRDAISGLFNGLDLTDANDLARAITFVGESFEGLSRFSAGVIESFQPLFQFFAGIAERASEGAESLDSLGRAFGIASQVNLFAGAVAGVVPVLEALLAILVVRQGVGLVGALGSLAGKLGGQAGVVALLGKLSAVGAAGGAGFALGKLADEATRTATGTGLSDRLSDWLTSFTDLNAQADRLVETTGPSADAQAAAIREADEAMQSFSGNIDRAVDFWGEFGSESGRVTATLQSYGDAAVAASESTEKLGADGQALTGYFSVVESGARGVASALDELSGLSDALQVELAIANLESQTEIAVAGLEADAKKTVAAFDSISVSVQSTGDAITDLFGLLGDGNISKLDKIDLRKQLDEENDRRQDSFDLQKKLTQAQIDEARARVAALSRGDALIKVNGDGLAPHLEAFMWEVLEAIQVRVNAQGYQFLLGSP